MAQYDVSRPPLNAKTTFFIVLYLLLFLFQNVSFNRSSPCSIIRTDISSSRFIDPEDYYTPFFETSANPPHADYRPTSDPGELHCVQKEDTHLSDSKYHAMQARFKPVTPPLFYLFRALPLYRNGASAWTDRISYRYTDSSCAFCSGVWDN